ncbi:MAG: Lpg1974 family pore-forming outer membrane protein [Chlamydiales bacterium]|nr:Lpg1974 family pore-forming outer membrane protein [Chlamydiales bacterium]
MKNKITLTLPAILTLFTSIVHGSSTNKQLSTLECVNFRNPAYCQDDVQISGELLYWKTNVQIPYALTHESSVSPNIDTNQKIQNVSFDYNPGFRIGAGYKFSENQWDTNVIWTYFQETDHSSVFRTDTIDVHTLWDVGTASGILSATSATAGFTQNFQTLDAVLGKTFFPNKPTILRYFIGIKGALIKEKENIFYNGTSNGDGLPLSSTVTLTNDFKGIGLTNGLNATWNIAEGWSLYGKGEFAALWGNFDLEQNYFFQGTTTDFPVPFTINNQNTIYALKMNLVTAIGVAWKYRFNNAALLTLSFGYEFNYWPNQVLLANFFENDQNLNGGLALLFQQPSDVGIHGFVLKAGLDF